MVPRGLVIAIILGVVAGGAFGLFFVKIDNNTQLEFVEGSSLSIVTEKTDFDKYQAEEPHIESVQKPFQKIR